MADIRHVHSRKNGKKNIKKRNILNLAIKNTPLSEQFQNPIENKGNNKIIEQS